MTAGDQHSQLGTINKNKPLSSIWSSQTLHYGKGRSETEEKAVGGPGMSFVILMIQRTQIKNMDMELAWKLK